MRNNFPPIHCLPVTLPFNKEINKTETQREENLLVNRLFDVRSLYDSHALILL